jgi:hypothetical protein
MTLSGFQARLAAKMALYNFCIWLNEQLGRPWLAFTDLVNWYRSSENESEIQGWSP